MGSNQSAHSNLSDATRVRLTSEQRLKLDLVTGALGVTESDLIRAAIDTELDRLLKDNGAALEAHISQQERRLANLRDSIRAM